MFEDVDSARYSHGNHVCEEDNGTVKEATGTVKEVTGTVKEATGLGKYSKLMKGVTNDRNSLVKEEELGSRISQSSTFQESFERCIRFIILCSGTFEDSTCKLHNFYLIKSNNVRATIAIRIIFFKTEF